MPLFFNTSGFATVTVFLPFFFLVTRLDGHAPLTHVTVTVAPDGTPPTLSRVNFVCAFVELENAKPSVTLMRAGGMAAGVTGETGTLGTMIGGGAGSTLSVIVAGADLIAARSPCT